jgi:dTDP-4-amino-4,6-dideoxygalactose transaminase
MSELAIKGGSPVRAKPFPEWPVWDEREEQELLAVLRSGRWGALEQVGSRVAQFQEAFAEANGATYGLCVSSGSTALQTALRAIDIGYGDEVIIPPYTFIATATSCLVVGAVPVFVDIDPRTYNIDPSKIEEAITDRTKALMPVHIGGCPADMDSVLEIAARQGLPVIEDACQAHAAAWRDQAVGSIGDMGCFSFQSSKNINAGEGGIVLTSDEELESRCWSARSYGRVRGGQWYEHETLGDNYRMTEWQAAILLAQLTRMEEMAAVREENATYLCGLLAGIDGLEPQWRDPRVTRHAYHLFISRYDAEAFEGLHRDRFLQALNAEGIPCARGYIPLYRTHAIQSAVRRLERFVTGQDAPYNLPDCPVTERACGEEGVWFTQSMLLGTRQDMDDIAAAVVKIKARAGELLD